MKQPEVCIFCKETEFKFHEEIELYNPDTDKEETIYNVYQCTTCLSYHFEEEGYLCHQKDIGNIVENYTPKLNNYMNS